MTAPQARILVVEDDAPHAAVLREILEREGYRLETAGDVESALDRLRVRPFDLILTDLKLGDRDGLDLLREARRLHPGIPVFLITGYGSIQTAVQAIQEGAADYITKPIHPDELRTRVAKELEKRRLVDDNRALRAQLDRRFGLKGIIGNSAGMKRIFDLVRQVAPTDATVLLLGESGTGKELFARALHQLSPRSGSRFVALNCAALTETLIESELFGHIKGAFTGAQQAKIGKIEFADGGTLFLDEVGDMPLSTQAKLLRVIDDLRVVPVGSNEERPVNVRFLAATNRDLEKKIHAGEFREDLFYRLAVVTLEVPPLRDRLEDLPLLVDHFARDFAGRHGRKISRVRDEVIDRLRRHAWPGNVRELRNAVETMVVLDRDGELGLDDLPRPLREPGGQGGDGAVLPAAGPAPGSPETGYRLEGKSLEEVERDLIAATLAAVEGNRQKAAGRLKMGERTLYRKIKEYGL